MARDTDQADHHHYIITIQWAGPRGAEACTVDGVVIPGPGKSRQDLFHDIHNHVAAQMPHIPQTAAVTFFALESNRL